MQISDFYNKKGVMILGAAGGLILFFVFLIQPLSGKVRLKEEELRLVEQKLEEGREMIKVAGKWGQGGALLRKEEISLAMDEITKAGKSFDVSFVSISPRETEAVPGISCRRLPIEINVKSRYQDLGTFLGSLEKLKKSVVTVRQFVLSRDEAQPSHVNSRMLVDVYLKDKE